MKAERKELDSVSAKKEKINGDKQKLIDQRKTLQELIDRLRKLDQQREELTRLQDKYRKADAESTKKRQVYEALNKCHRSPLQAT